MKKFEFKYQFEFFCSPIWIEENVKNPTPRNVEIADLDINPYLKEELEELNHLYQEIFNDNYPLCRSEERRVGKECRSRCSPYR